MGVARAALILMLGNVVSRLLGIVREQVIAGLFGATATTDAFTAAARVPTTIYDLLIGGMISAALVPIFSSYRDDDPDLGRLASTVLNMALIALVLVAALLAAIAPQLMWVFGYGFDPQTQELSIRLVRVMMPAVVFMGASGILSGLLYSRRRFLLPALAISIYNGGIVAGAILFHNQLGITSLVVGVLLGAFFQLALQAFVFRRVRYSLYFNPFHPQVRRILALYLPVALGLLVSALGIALDSNLASRTGEGNLAAMRFATTMIQFPLGLLAAATSFAVLPTLSRYAAAMVAPSKEGAASQEPLLPEAIVDAPAFEAAIGDRPVVMGINPGMGQAETPRAKGSEDAEPALTTYKATIALGIKVLLYTVLPATVGLIMLRFPLVQLLFQHGTFDADAASRTALAFLAYSPGLPAAAIDQLLIFSFYARRDTVTPVIVGVIGIGIYLIVALALIQPLGMAGLALANSAQWIVHAILMFLLLWRTVNGLGGLGLLKAALKAAAATTIMGLALVLAAPLLAGLIPPQGSSGQAGYILLSITLGLSTYVLALVLTGVEELRPLRQLVRDRLMK